MSNRTIYKYPILLGEINNILVPCGSKILMFGTQLTNRDPSFHEANLFVWIEQDRNTNPPLHHRKFEVIGTGHTVPADGEYVGSTQQGPFVWHLYELGV